MVEDGVVAKEADQDGQGEEDESGAAEEMRGRWVSNPGPGVIELPPVVALDGLNNEAELSGHPGKEMEEGGEGL